MAVKNVKMLSSKLLQGNFRVHLILNSKVILATFRLEYEYEYDFSNLVLMPWIVTFHTNLVLIDSLATGQQQGRVRALGT